MTTESKADTHALGLIALDRLDDDLIIQELQGRAVSTWVYKFKQDGQEITGLSISGVEQACRDSGRKGEAIRVLRHEWRETEDAFYGTVEAGRYYVGGEGHEVLVDTAIGAKREQKLKWSKKRRGWYTDSFAFEKAISKAARNAKAKLLDDRLKSEIVAMALKEGRYRQVKPADVREAQAATNKEDGPPSANRVKADEARRRFFAIAEELGLAGPAAIHAHVRLKCHGEGRHSDDDPAACHMLSDSIRYLESQGKTTADAWDEMTKRLGPESPLEPDDADGSQGRLSDGGE
jgi:hypothetical protein